MENIGWLMAQFKKTFDRLKNEKFKRGALQAIPFWIASIITGIVAVIYTRIFLLAETICLRIFHWHNWLLFGLSPLCFLLAWWLVARFSPYGRGSGIPQVMAAIQISSPTTTAIIDKLLSLRVIVVKVVSSMIMAIGGGIIGREGPTMQISASIYKLVYQVLPNWWPQIAKRNMMVTGAAAGLAAAFNTPLGGIVFAIEELTKTHFSHFKTAIFTSVIIAGLSAQAFLGPYLYIGFPKIDNLSFYIFLGVALVAIIAGLLGSGMARLILYIFSLKKKYNLNRHQVIYVIACGLIVAALGYFISDDLLGSGKEVMVRMLFTNNKYSAWYIPLLRIAGSVVSFTTGAAGGIFAPALSAGATVGSVVAGWFALPDNDTNLLILAGMVAFLTGVTRSPFTSVVLVLEMTNHDNVIFHLILSGMVASLVSVLVDKHSLYDYLKIQYIHELTHHEHDAAVVKAIDDMVE